MKILIVDDDAFIRNAIKRLILAKYPTAEIFEAEDGVDGFDLYKLQRPNIVITDVVMKGLGGEWLLENILSHDRNAKIIVMSGQDQIYLLKYKLMGARGILRKPIKYQELYQQLDDIFSELYTSLVI